MTLAADEDWKNGGFGLYLHWPFCQAKCPYCDFNSHVAQQIDQDRWKAAYISEIDRFAAETPDRILNSVFFGGGTPSLMSPDLVAAILDRVRLRWPMVNDPEVTLEANPGSVEAGRFRAYNSAGVNRISMGIQALDDASLRRLGRIHTSSEALKAFDVARSVFDRVSFDLIYARQDQTLLSWRKELSLALSMAVDHLSLYQLTIEDGTVFAARLAKGALSGLPDEAVGADLFEATQELCGLAGFPAYEVSNHARPGSESRHNLIYWRSGDYVGIGPGAHGRLTLQGNRWATEAPKSPDFWLGSVEKNGRGELGRICLTSEDRAMEMLIMGLRLVEGLDIRRYEAISEQPLNRAAVQNLAELEMITLLGDVLCVTDRGRALLNAVIRELA